MTVKAEQIIFSQEDWRVLDSLQLRNLSALKGICDDMSKQIIRELSDGINAGEGMPKLSARIQEATRMGKTRADLIARTETITAAVDGCRTRFEQSGVKEFEYIAASDARTCDQCAAHDGKIYKLTDNVNIPPLHPNCRCAIAPIVGNRKKEIEQTLRQRTPAETPEQTQTPPVTYSVKETLKPGTQQNKETKAALEAAENWTDLSSAMKNRYGHAISVTNTIQTKMRFADIKESIVAADKVIEDMPSIAKQLRGLEDFISLKTYAEAYPTVISFGSFYRTRHPRKKLQDALDDDYNTNYHPSAEVVSVYIHELGHIAEAALIKKKNDGNFRGIEWKYSTRAREIVYQAALNLERKEQKDPTWIPGKGTPSDIASFVYPYQDKISGYATKNYSETLAEAFADYYCNGEEARDISKEIIRLLKEELR